MHYTVVFGIRLVTTSRTQEERTYHFTVFIIALYQTKSFIYHGTVVVMLRVYSKYTIVFSLDTILLQCYGCTDDQMYLIRSS